MKATKAVEIRNELIKAQYGIVTSEIEKAKSRRELCVYFKDDDAFDPKVLHMLAKEGFDIECVKGFMSVISYTKISWEKAEEGREGKITRISTMDLVRIHGLPALKKLKKNGEVLLREIKVRGNSLVEEVKKQKDKFITMDSSEKEYGDTNDGIPFENDEEAFDEVILEKCHGNIHFFDEEEFDDDIYEDVEECETTPESEIDEDECKEDFKCDFDEEVVEGKRDGAEDVAYTEPEIAEEDIPKYEDELKEFGEAVKKEWDKIKECIDSSGARDVFMKALEQGNEKLGQLIERNKSFIDNLNKKKNDVSNGSKKDDNKK